MAKKINLEKSVSELVKEYPEVKDIMAGLGFKDITNPVALSTVGRIMTIPKGAQIKGIEMDKVISTFQEHGFEIEKEAANPAPKTDSAAAAAPAGSQETGGSTDEAPASTPEERSQLLKSYVARLSAGEDLEAVRQEFVKNFRSVDAAEIAKAEQELIQSGARISDVQRLCDVHSALFHGATKEEQIARAEQAVMDSLQSKTGADASAQEFAKITSHPVNVFLAENEELGRRIQVTQIALAAGASNEKTASTIPAVRAASIHYARKGDLIYPLLNRTYGFSGPADVMWGVDDEIRDELTELDQSHGDLPDFRQRLTKVLDRAQEMIYKENNILFPLCIQKFSEEDWMRIYYEMPAYDTILAGGYPLWKEAEEKRAELKTIGGKTVRALKEEGGQDSSEKAGQIPAENARIPLGSGHLTRAQIEAVLNTIPMEISFIDEQNINRYFNDGEKLFKRPDMAIDRDVFSCHPPKVQEIVKGIIESFRDGSQSSVEVWMEKKGEPVLVRYMAVRDEQGNYLGTMECVQKMGFAKGRV